MRTKVFAALAVVALAAATFGCDDSSDDDADGTAGTAATTTEATEGTDAPEFTGEPVVLGVSSALDPPIPPSVPDHGKAATAAAMTLNAEGGITTADGLTHEIEIVHCDNDNDQTQTAECARRFVDEEVDAVVGSSVVLSDVLVPPLAEAGIPYFMPVIMSSGMPEMTSPNSFALYVTPVLFVGAAMDLAAAGYTKTAVVYLPAGAPFIPAVEAGLAAQGGSIAKRVEVPQANPNWPTIAAEATEGTDSAILIVDQANATPFIAAVGQIGKELPMSTVAAIVNTETIDVTGGAGSALVGSQVAGPWATPDHEAWADYRASMEEYAPDVQLTSTTQDAWLSVVAIASVISGIDGPVDRASVLAQLNQTTDLGTFGGKLPEGIDLTTSRSETLPRVFHPSYWGPIDVTADGLTDSDGAEFKNAFDLLLESMGLA